MLGANLDVLVKATTVALAKAPINIEFFYFADVPCRHTKCLRRSSIDSRSLEVIESNSARLDLASWRIELDFEQ